MNKLKQIYYNLKYRNTASAVAIIPKSKRKKVEFERTCEEYAKALEPCYKTNTELLEYIKNKYGLKKVELTEHDAESYKINYIMNLHPELLTSSMPELLSGNKMPSRKEMSERNEAFAKCLAEAKAYPLEKLGISLEIYKFFYTFPCGTVAEFTIRTDSTNDDFNISSSVKRKTSDEEQNIIHKIHDDICLYRGVSKEDIENRTPRFLGYVSTLIRQKIPNK